MVQKLTPAQEIDNIRRSIGHYRVKLGKHRLMFNEHKLTVRYRHRQFGRLRVDYIFYGGLDNRARARCICDCGRKKTVRLANLIRDFVISCGCYNVELKYIHGDLVDRRTKGIPIEYNSWVHMKDRCYNINNRFYKYYGGRGIVVCDRWLGKYGYKHFLKDMKRRKNVTYTLDRIDVDGNYEPDNCRWASKKIQVINRRKNKTWRADLYVEAYITQRRSIRDAEEANSL